jgi:hypothetical protein
MREYPLPAHRQLNPSRVLWPRLIPARARPLHQANENVIRVVTKVEEIKDEVKP